MKLSLTRLAIIAACSPWSLSPLPAPLGGPAVADHPATRNRRRRVEVGFERTAGSLRGRLKTTYIEV
jgi:hypothetical protein